MKSISPKRFWRCVKPLIPIIAVGLIGIVISRAISGCAREKPPPPWSRPLTYDRVPVIRVLITPRPIERASVTTTGAYGVLVDDTIISRSDAPLGETLVTRSGGNWSFGLLSGQGRQIVLEPVDEVRSHLGATSYRGSIHFLPVGEKKFIVVNYLDLESYLAGVLPKELYSYWSSETYRALSVAARTFAMYHMLRSGSSQEYDLGSTQSAQVYGGYSAETQKSWQAVRFTHGQVLTFGQAENERVFMTQYSASCGGRVNPAHVIRNANDIEPLRGGQECDDCAGSSRYRWPPVQITKTDLHRALRESYKEASALEEIKELRVTGKTPFGRFVWVEARDGNNHSIRVRAEDIRLALLRSSIPAARKLYSMNCQFRDLGNAIEFYDGRGFGHGVGLCQWGAQGKAAKGITGKEILRFYYPGARILRAY